MIKYKGETKTAVMSFDVHPLCVLKGEKRQSIITLEEKKELLEEMGIDYLLVIHFTKEVAALSPQAFIDEYLNKLPLKRLVCGYDFHFGDHNSGNIEDLKKQGLWFVCADMGGTQMYQLNLKGPIGLVIGSEGEGVGRLVKENCDYIASIPMKGNIDSLNASVAAGVLAYEIVRQRLL